jgi:hypothetical protein
VLGKIAMAGGALIAVAAFLPGIPGLGGPTDTHLLFAVGTVIALNLSKERRQD